MGYMSCGLCKGTGRFYTKSGKALDCRACGGSGVDRSRLDTKCERCRGTIVYKSDQNAPRFCKECRNIQLEKRCAQSGCSNTIRYNVGWTQVPNYCKRCETKRREGCSASTCPGTGVFICGKIVWSPPGKNFKYCKECGEKDRAQKEAQWKIKSCKFCKQDIRYHVSWENIPDYCPNCREWKRKVCATSGCSGNVQYKVFWDNPPDLCEDCRKEKRQEGEGKHGYAYRKARQQFMLSSLNDPTVASRIKEWIQQERSRRGDDGYWRSPPGFDVGHIIPGIDDPSNFRWESIDMNRSRGGKHRR